MMQRTPIKINRVPIKVLSSVGHHKTGGWMVFNRPPENPPNLRTKKNERVLWCPWCGEWTVYKSRANERDVQQCQGSCGWANTNDFYVKMANKLWWDGVPLEQIKKVLASR